MNQNLKAVLDTIAFAEGTSTSPATLNDGYDVIVTGVDGKPEIFTDYTTHPFALGRQSKVINRNGLTSNAAGRYQFMARYWPHYSILLRLPDFGPESQDRWAIQLIKEQRAFDDVLTGHFIRAIGKVSNIWASLPGAGYGQREHAMADLENAYERAGGTFA